MALVSKNFSDIITFTRASTGTYFNSAGVLTSAAIDAPRLDYNPSTLAAQGLLIEEARTNSIRNNTMVGAVAGTPGTLPTNWSTFTTLTGLTREIVGTGTESGITYIDIRLSGTPSAAGSYSIFTDASNNPGAAALNGQTWNTSLYVKLAAGTTAGLSNFVLNLAENNAAGTFLANSNVSFTPTTSALATQRPTHARTLNQATTAFTQQYISLNLTGVAIDITLRIGLPQLEQGAFATSVIPTTTTALTRAADVASVNTLSPWFNASQGTLYTETLATRQIAIAGTGLAMFDDATVNNNIRSFIGASGAARVVVAASGVTSADLFPGSAIPASTVLKFANAYATDNFAAVSNASAAATDTTGAVPAVSIFRLGFDFVSGVYLNGYLRRVVFYPRRLSNAELQAITA
jgi:hypothetical protein